jgi:hypothetical protein
MLEKMTGTKTKEVVMLISMLMARLANFILDGLERRGLDAESEKKRERTRIERSVEHESSSTAICSVLHRSLFGWCVIQFNLSSNAGLQFVSSLSTLALWQDPVCCRILLRPDLR